MRQVCAFLAMLAAFGLGGVAQPAFAGNESPAYAPVIVNPAEGEVVTGGSFNTVRVDFSPAVAADDYEVSVVLDGGCYQPAGAPRCAAFGTVPITGSTAVVNVTLNGPVTVNGKYQVHLIPVGGGYGVSGTFTLTGGTDFDPPTEPEPAPAAVQIQSPTNGGTVPEDFTGPVTIYFPPTSTSTTYRLILQNCCNGEDYWWEKEVSTNGGASSFTVPAMAKPDYYSLDVYPADGWTELDSVGFTVEDTPEPMLVDNVSISPATFYPRVRDGFRDATRISYRLGIGAQVVASVYNRDGQRVRRAKVGWQYRGFNGWTWNGRRDNGTLARVGTYRVSITATNGDGVTKTVAQKATVTSDVVTRRGSTSKSGVGTYATSRSGNCYANRIRPDLSLDCWGGEYASATYRLALPRSASNLDWSVSGYQGCCDRGTISKSGTRLNRTTFEIAMRVTIWRSYTIQSVRVAYHLQGAPLDEDSTSARAPAERGSSPSSRTTKRDATAVMILRFADLGAVPLSGSKRAGGAWPGPSSWGGDSPLGPTETQPFGRDTPGRSGTRWDSSCQGIALSRAGKWLRQAPAERFTRNE